MMGHKVTLSQRKGERAREGLVPTPGEKLVCFLTKAPEVWGVTSNVTSSERNERG